MRYRNRPETLGPSNEELVASYQSEVRKGKSGNEFLDQLVLRNHGLIFKAAVANGIRELVEANFDDIMQAGRIAIVKAAKRFDPERGKKFSTLAVWWIRSTLFTWEYHHKRSLRYVTEADLFEDDNEFPLLESLPDKLDIEQKLLDEYSGEFGRVFVESFNKLSELERICFGLRYGIIESTEPPHELLGPMSVTEIMEYVDGLRNSPEAKAYFKNPLTKKFSETAARTHIDNARRKLRKHFRAKGMDQKSTLSAKIDAQQ